jgi:hypothetical protein
MKWAMGFRRPKKPRRKTIHPTGVRSIIVTPTGTKTQMFLSIDDFNLFSSSLRAESIYIITNIVKKTMP